MKIFVSSTLTGLKAERKKVIDQTLKLGHQPVAMEHFSSSPEPPLEECLSRVEESDLLVLILGPFYGSIHPRTDLSIIENECRYGKKLGMDVLAFWIESLEPKIVEVNPTDPAEKYKRFLGDVKSSGTI